MKRLITILFLAASLTGWGQVTIDSYNQHSAGAWYDIYTGFAGKYRVQTYTNTKESRLDSCKIFGFKYGSPTGSVYAYIYAHTGTYGTNGTPTGSALATSDAVNIAGISATDSVYIKFTFSGANKIIQSEATPYCLVVSYNGGNASNCLRWKADATSPTHSGNRGYSADGVSWTGNATYDAHFFVYGNYLIKKIAGVTDANTKKVAGVADANIKKISGKTK